MNTLTKPLYVSEVGTEAMVVDREGKGKECEICDVKISDCIKDISGLKESIVKKALCEAFKNGYKKCYIVAKNVKQIEFYNKIGFISSKENANKMYYNKETK